VIVLFTQISDTVLVTHLFISEYIIIQIVTDFMLLKHITTDSNSALHKHYAAFLLNSLLHNHCSGIILYPTAYLTQLRDPKAH
jgi:hypothetical protein